MAKPCNCPAVYKPVCAELPGGARRTFGNSCLAGCAKAAVVGNEPCSGSAAVQPGGRLHASVVAGQHLLLWPSGWRLKFAGGYTCGGLTNEPSKVDTKDRSGLPFLQWSKMQRIDCGPRTSWSTNRLNAAPALLRHITLRSHVYRSGAAGGEGDTCGGLAGVPCKGGLICDAPATPDAQGVCRKLPPADGAVNSHTFFS